MANPNRQKPPSSLPARNAKGPRIDVAADRRAKALNFCKAIMSDLLEADNSEIKCVMSAIPDPYTGFVRNVVIREEDFRFWNNALAELRVATAVTVNVTPNRVVVVGTPGIGKSTTTCFAIRLILLEKKTVVYLYRTPEREGYYIELSLSENNNNNNNGEMEIELQLHSEKMSSTEILSLYDPETYFIVDPGLTKTSCNPAPMVAARVIIVASPDEGHWGGSSFEKDDQTGLGGFLLYFPLWSLSQLTAASGLLDVEFASGDSNEDEVAELYSIFGGIPRQVFAPSRKERKKKELKRKVETLSDASLRDLVTGQLNRHSGFGEDQPGGGVVAFVPSEDFTDVELKLASLSILEWVRARYMDSIWVVLATYPSPISWQLLEAYLLHALQATDANQYTVRACVGKLDVTYTQFRVHALGQCTGKLLAADCTTAVLNGPDLTVFYSSDRFHPLYDMIYKVGNIYYAFQVTIGKSHDAKQQQINQLVQQLQIGITGRELKLYYAVHEGVFDAFVTTPVTINLAPGVSIFHLKLENGTA